MNNGRDALLDKLGAGDLKSNARGSGARFNAGKPPLHLIPADVLGVWAASWNYELVEECTYKDALDLLYVLGEWQRREIQASAMLALFEPEEIEEAAWVLDFGRKKYAEWNWAKGMAWSIPVGSIERHLLKILGGELVDPESGRTHMAHVLCNIIMLVHYERYYQEGDDRPPVEIFNAQQARD